MGRRRAVIGGVKAESSYRDKLIISQVRQRNGSNPHYPVRNPVYCGLAPRFPQANAVGFDHHALSFRPLSPQHRLRAHKVLSFVHLTTVKATTAIRPIRNLMKPKFLSPNQPLSEKL
jgi:hypothetical protein